MRAFLSAVESAVLLHRELVSVELFWLDTARFGQEHPTAIDLCKMDSQYQGGASSTVYTNAVRLFSQRSLYALEMDFELHQDWVQEHPTMAQVLLLNREFRGR